MADIILDTNILSDLIIQYYSDDFRHKGYFESKGRLNVNLIRRLNRIVKWYLDDNDTFHPGLIVASSFAFVEIARQFDNIIGGQVTIPQFAAFIAQPPEWFLISAVDNTLFPHLSNLPRDVTLPNNNVKPLEWADTIHIATAMSRDEPWFLAVTDRSIRAIEFLKDKII